MNCSCGSFCSECTGPSTFTGYVTQEGLKTGDNRVILDAEDFDAIMLRNITQVLAKVLDVPLTVIHMDAMEVSYED